VISRTASAKIRFSSASVTATALSLRRNPHLGLLQTIKDSV